MSIISDSDFERNSSFLVNKKRIETISELLNYIEYLENKWNQKELWFRGVSDYKYELVPKIYRNEVWTYNEENANNLFFSFIRAGKQMLNSGENLERWNWYQIQQHYGLPTRLLDWTEGYLIALYFAIRKIDVSNEPCIWVLNPFQLNNISTGLYKLFYTDNALKDKEDLIVEKYLYDNNELPYLPIAILPAYVDQRIKVQKSCFTVHGRAQDEFDQVFFESREKSGGEFNLVQLVFSPTSSKKIKKEVIAAGISESTLFPDLEGLARELKDKYGMK